MQSGATILKDDKNIFPSTSLAKYKILQASTTLKSTKSCKTYRKISPPQWLIGSIFTAANFAASPKNLTIKLSFFVEKKLLKQKREDYSSPYG